MSGERNFTTDLTRRLVLDMVAGRSLGNVAYSDGATANRRIEHSPGAALAGGLPLTIPFEFDVPTSNPSGTAYVANLTSAALDPTAAWSLRITVATDGGMQIRQVGATTGDYRVLIWAGFRAAYSGVKGLRGTLVVENPNTTTAPKIYVQGSDISANFSLTTAGTSVPNWTPPELVTSYWHVGFSWPAGRAPMAEIGLGAWTLAEHQEWVQTGRKPTWWELGTGSAENRLIGDTSTFTSGVGLWVNEGGLLASFAATGGKLSIGLAASGASNAGIPAILSAGFRYRMRFKARLVAGASLTCYAGNGIGYATSRFTFTPTGTEQVFAGEFTPSGISTALRIGAATSNGATIEVDDVELWSLGPIIKTILQPGCPVLPDSGANMLVGLATPGITILGPKPPVVEIPIPTMSADGFILADQTLVPEGYKLTDADIQRMSGASTGTVTIRETSSGGTTIASATLGATPVAATLSNVYSASGKKLHLTNSSWSSSTVKGRLVFQRYQ
jgi:hypothetical protein